MQREPNTFDSDGTDYTEINIGQHGEVEISSGGSSGGGGSYYGGYIVLPLTPPAGDYFQIPGVDYGNTGNRYSTTSTRIIISVEQRLKYPNLAKILDGLLSKVRNNKALMDALKEFTHLSEEQIIANLTNGGGPLLKVVPDSQLPLMNSKYENGIILVAESVANDTNYYSLQTPTAVDLFVTAAILHEFVHFGENTTKIFRLHNSHYDDAGYQFQEKYYGGKYRYNSLTKELTLVPITER